MSMRMSVVAALVLAFFPNALQAQLLPREFALRGGGVLATASGNTPPGLDPSPALLWSAGASAASTFAASAALMRLIATPAWTST